MYFCNTQEINYTKAPAKVLLPGIIANSITIEPWDIVPFGGIHICFTPSSKITWGKESVTMTNFFFSAREYIMVPNQFDMMFSAIGSVKHYPNNKLTTIDIHKNEFSKNNKTIKFVPLEKISFVGKTINVGEPFVDYKDTKMIISASNIQVCYKNKEKFNSNMSYYYNITQNRFEGFNLEALLERTKENTFKVIDNFL